MWLDEVAGYFHDNGATVSEILDAPGCREGWIQGELFRYFRKRNRFVDVNTYAYRLGGIADFSADGPPPMVGEIKVLGGGYQTKVVTGGAIRPYRAFSGTIRRSHGLKLMRGPFGLVPDYVRLTSVRARQRLLVLVIDQQSVGPLSETLSTINFHGDHLEVECGRAKARIWRLA